MTIHRLLLGAGLVAGILACSGPRIQYDYDSHADFRAYRTYGWQPGPGGGRNKGGGFANDIMDQRVRRATEAALEAKGYQPGPAGGADFLVAYHPLQRTKRTGPPRVGVGMGILPGVGVGVGVPVGSGHVEEEGSIVLEIRDARTGAQVWKATAPGVLHPGDSPKEADDAVNDAVRSMLKRFPPK